MNLATIKLIADVLDAAEILAEIARRFKGNEDVIRQMVAEGRDPTPEEWDALQSERDAHTASIENA